jgi:hydroxymethylpyrimidine/phosphomethylpyrimidine kinase
MAQLAAVLDDIPPRAAKTGALGSSETVRAIAEASVDFSFPLVVDPVMVSTHGDALTAGDTRRALRDLLLPRAFLVTPNLQEAAELAGFAVDDLAGMERAARAIAALGPAAVIVKGGHLEGQAVDVLWWQNEIRYLEAPRYDTRHTHGTGCTFAAAITAELAKGSPLPDAVHKAKQYVSRAIASAPGLGKGFGPVNHHAATDFTD